MPSQLPIVRYALDPTGHNVDNAVSGEVKNLSPAQIRAAATTYGPFFTESLTVYDHSNNRLLVRGVDYQCIEMLQEATLRFGKEIAQLILIINPAVSSSVRLNYQVLGGHYQNNNDALVNIYNTYMMDDRPVDWSNVLNKPLEYTPSLHAHLLEDLVGFEPVVVALERIRNAIVLSDVPAFEALIDWVNANAGSAVMVDPVLPEVDVSQTHIFTVTTSNKRNGTTYYWVIDHRGTEEANFVATSGEFTLFQNKATFSINTSSVAPFVAGSFDILIKAGSVNGPVVTMVEGIVYFGQTVPVVGQMTMMDMLTACCLSSPKIKVNAKSLFVIGDR
jgi:hypothetical protein